MVAIGWILIGAYILFILLLLAKEEYSDRREKRRRNDLRAEIRWPVIIHTDQESLEGETVNISAGGALICCERDLALNAIIRIIIKPAIQSPLDITAEVVRTNIQCGREDTVALGTAIRFVIITEKDRRFLSFRVFDHLQGTVSHH